MIEGKRNQRGFTLLELILAIAISGVLAVGLGSLTLHTFRVTAQSRAKITALEDIKAVVRPIVSDVWMAKTSTPGDGESAADSLVLDWTSWYDDDSDPPELTSIDYHCEYTFLQGQGQIQRKYWEDYDVGSPGDPTSTTTVGRYISSIAFSRDGYLVAVTIASSPEERTETEEQKTYHIQMHPMSEVPVQ